MNCDVTTKDGTIRITLAGQLIFSDTAPFADVLGQLKAAAASTCTVDLTRLEHIDSSGLRMLLLVHDACRDGNISLIFAGADGQVREMLLHSRFDTIVTIDG